MYRITLPIILGTGQTGLTLKAQFVDHAGANVGAEIADGFVEIGSGNYLFDYANVPDGHRGGIKILKDDGTLMAFAGITPEDVERIDASIGSVKAKTDLIPAAGPLATNDARLDALDNLDAPISSLPTTSEIEDAVLDAAAADHNINNTVGHKINAAGSAADPLENQVPGNYASGTAGAALGRVGMAKVITTSPVAQSGDLEIVRGDDYFAADSRAIDFLDSNNKWPELTGAEVLFKCGEVEVAMSIVTAVGANKTVRLELSSANTTALPEGRNLFSVIATLGNGHEVTLVVGALRFKAVSGLA